MKDRAFQKIMDFLRSPLGVGAVFVVIAFVALVFFSVRTIINNNRDVVYEIDYEYDPASGTNIALLPPTNGTEDDPSPIYVATTEIINSGVPIWHWIVFEHVIEDYAENNEIDLTRVSYLKDSYNLAAIYVFDFSVVLNIDQQTIKVRIDASKNRKDILGSIYILSDESGKELYRFEVAETDKCRFERRCS